MPTRYFLALLIFFGLLIAVLWVQPQVTGSTEGAFDSEIDAQLALLLAEAGITPLDLGPTPDPAKVKLGEALFFDPILSGNQDISCATCHHPTLNTGDGLALSVGTGGKGLGLSREMGAGRQFVPRHATEIYNRGSPEWQTMFWDGRISLLEDKEEGLSEGATVGDFESPARVMLPAGLENILAIQAMFPVTSRDEMRGEEGDLTVLGEPNEVAMTADAYLPLVWEQLMSRLMAIPAYQTLFAEAYPEASPETLGFQHAANALAAFQIDAFSFDDSPWDRYLAGEQQALSPEAKEGALLFYGKADCVRCHSGSLMTDQQYHNLGVPQFGPGKRKNEGDLVPQGEAGLDLGRFLQTKEPADAFAFRTPPLRNVTLTGPWFHNGAYSSLEGVIRHHTEPAKALRSYDLSQLDARLAETHQGSEMMIERILQTLDPTVESMALSDDEIQQLLAFLAALSSPSAQDLATTIPSRVPSGLPLDDLASSN